MDRNHDAARDAPPQDFRNFTRACQALDPSMVGFHFHEPALQVTPDGTRTLPSLAAAAQADQPTPTENLDHLDLPEHATNIGTLASN